MGYNGEYVDLSVVTTAITDVQTKIGTPAADVSTDIASVKTDTGTTLPATLATLPAATTTDVYKIYPTTSNPTNPNGSPSATADTFGSWAERIPASTITNNFALVGINFRWTDKTVDQTIYQIATGGAGSESVIFEGAFKCDQGLNNGQGTHIFNKPLAIAANARVAVRVKCSASSKNGTEFKNTLMYYEV